MLVFSRKEGESIVIQDRILVSVLHIRGHGVRIGIEAPKEMAVHRKEIAEAIISAEYDEQRATEKYIPKKG